MFKLRTVLFNGDTYFIFSLSQAHLVYKFLCLGHRGTFVGGGRCMLSRCPGAHPYLDSRSRRKLVARSNRLV